MVIQWQMHKQKRPLNTGKNRGIISKNFKLKKELWDEFAQACAAAGISQTEAIKKNSSANIRHQRKPGCKSRLLLMSWMIGSF